ncbi:MAG: transport system ATP-binding/permease protein [Actinomycetota bacterium]|jgi:ABC-type multidrug transport system ATPase subunit
MPDSLLHHLDQTRPTRSRKPAVTQPVALSLRHVTAHAPDGTRLLDDVSFDVARGSLIAVAGPTGAGKTSLARALTGSLRVDAGTITLHGQALGNELAVGRVAYVPQQDTLHTDLSLRQALEHSAVLRLPTDTPEARSTQVDRSLNELGLTAHASTMVRDLSVGQRKRASIAAQLLGDPDLVVLDEPTAGLDPGYERVVLDAVRALAASGRTIVVVTHSLAAIGSCDRVVFLAAGGRVAFAGPPSQVTQYFELTDPADVFLALDTHEATRFEPADEPIAATEPTETTGRAKAPFLRQVAMLVRRDVHMLRADRRRLLLLALQAPIVGALLLAVLPIGALSVTDHSPNSRALVVVMFLVLSTMWPGVTNAIREVVKERAITRLEVASGLSPRAYVASKVLLLGAITMTQSSLIAYVATGRQHIVGDGVLLPMRFELVAAAALVGLVACTLGLAFSAITTTPDKALALLPTALVVQLAFAGTWAETSHLPLLRGLRSLMGSRWGMEAMAGTLRGDATQWRAAIVALSALIVGAIIVTVVFVGRATRSLAARTHAERTQLISRVTPHTAGATLAVLLSIGAAATGAVTLSSLGHPAPAATHAAAVAKAVAGPTPTTAVAAAPVITPATTPVTAAAVVAAPKPVVRRTVTTAPPAEAQPEEPVSDGSATTPDTTPTTAAPVTTTPTTVKPASTNAWWTAYMNSYGGGR